MTRRLVFHALLGCLIELVDNDKGIGVAKSEIERLQFATCALQGLLCGGAPLGASVFQQALGSLSCVRRLDQVLRHAAPPSSVFPPCQRPSDLPRVPYFSAGVQWRERRSPGRRRGMLCEE